MLAALQISLLIIIRESPCIFFVSYREIKNICSRACRGNVGDLTAPITVKEKKTQKEK
jgi:hypothetical protein